MGRFIDFKKIRSELDVHDIIDHYGIVVARKNGEQYSVHCPFHEDKKPSMGLHTGKKIFKCHSCGKGGNMLDLVTMLEGLDPKSDIRNGAIIALDTFLGGGGEEPQKRSERQDAKEVNDEADNVDLDLPNVEFGRAIKQSLTHRTLRERGFKEETYKLFEVGYSAHGMMKGRIAFRLYDENQMPIGYIGRWATDPVPNDQARYLLPKNINKKRILYNWHRIRVWEPKHVVIVEGLWSVLRLYELNVPVVATLGHEVFEQQIDMLVRGGVEQVTIIYDGDDPGRAGADNASAALAKHLFVRSIVLADGQKPDTMPESIIKELPTFE